MKKGRKCMALQMLTVAALLCLILAGEGGGGLRPSLSRLTGVIQTHAAVRRKTYKISLRKGSRKKLKVPGYRGKIRWKSKNRRIVRVSAKGRITALKKGKTRVYAYLKGRKKKRICFQITVRARKKKKTAVPKKNKTASQSQASVRDRTDPLQTAARDRADPLQTSETVCPHRFLPVYRETQVTVTDHPAWEEETFPDTAFAEECGCGRQFFVCYEKDSDTADLQALDLKAKEAHARHCQEICAPYEAQIRQSESGEEPADGAALEEAYRLWQEAFDLHSSYHWVRIPGRPVIIRHEAVTHIRRERTCTGFRCSLCGQLRANTALQEPSGDRSR